LGTGFENAESRTYSELSGLRKRLSGGFVSGQQSRGKTPPGSAEHRRSRRCRLQHRHESSSSDAAVPSRFRGPDCAGSGSVLVPWSRTLPPRSRRLCARPVSRVILPPPPKTLRSTTVWGWVCRTLGLVDRQKLEFGLVERHCANHRRAALLSDARIRTTKPRFVVGAGAVISGSASVTD